MEELGARQFITIKGEASREESVIQGHECGTEQVKISARNH